MASSENKEIKVTASDALEFEPVLHEPTGGGWGLKSLLALLIVGGAVGGWVVYGDALMQRFIGGGDAGVPTIRAASGPVKVRPENPGGLKVPNRDKLVYDRMQKGPESGVADRGPERLLPPPEQPLPKPHLKTGSKTAPAAETKPAAKEAPAAQIKPTEKTNPVAKVPTLKDVKAAKRPTPPPPPPAPPSSSTSTAGSTASGASFSQAGKTGSAPAQPVRKAPKKAPVKQQAVAKPVEKTAATAKKVSPPPAQIAPQTVAAISRDKAYLVQLAAARSSEGAREEWARLKGKHPDLLGHLGLTITKADLGAGKGVFYRLRAGPLVDEGSARGLCRQLSLRQIGCLVIKPMQ
ncbi:MAG: SPOR domain-containing protein [Alphaproteobacteria bacterium]|nr:SPOR domain-containing protein [Alphaproteobacteria bacterium]